MRTRALVLDGSENQAVACARSLARAGFEVWVGAEHSWSKAGMSRAASAQFRYSSPAVDPGGFVADIVRAAEEVPGTLVLPMTELSSLALSASRGALDAVGARYVLPAHADLLRATDKVETGRLAAALGATVPQSVVVRNTGDVLAETSRLRLPVVLKPRSSEEPLPGGGARRTGAPLYAKSPEELLRSFAIIGKRTRDIVIQEFVVGEGAGYFALMERGELRAEFAHRRLRDVRPTGSGSALRESVAIEPALRATAVGMLKSLRWHGVAMVEFKVRPDGTPVFLEINGRFWNSLALSAHAGVDFPGLLAQVAMGGVLPITPPSYKAGVRCRWLLGDFRHLAAVFMGPPAGFPLKFPGRIRTLTRFLLPVRGTYHDNFELRDPLPELGDWISFFLYKIPSVFARRSYAPQRSVPQAPGIPTDD